MHLSYLLDVAVLVSLGTGALSSPVAQGSTSNCVAGDIAIVKRTASEPTYFCTWWNAESVEQKYDNMDTVLIRSRTRTSSPFLELTAFKVNNACKCISPSSRSASNKKRAALIERSGSSSSGSAESCMAELSLQFTQPWRFCNFYTAASETTSPFRKYSAQSLIVLCNCVEGKPIPASTKGTSTKNTSSVKSTSKSSSTKAPIQTTSTKSSTSKRITSSSSKITSSSKQSSSTLSSSRKSTSSTTKTSSSKTTSSAPKPTSSSKFSTSSLQKTTSSSKVISSTKKTSSSSSSTKQMSSSTAARSSSSLIRSLSSTSRRSLSISSSYTVIKPSSSTKSSAKISSSIRPSVITTTSSKSSTKLSSSSKPAATSSNLSKSSSGLISSASSLPSSTTQASSTSVSSATATKTHTVRTDGQFYLRIANTTAPPNDYYITLGEGFDFQPSRDILFVIDSNGYLYQPAQENRFNAYWPAVQSFSNGKGFISAYSSFGYPSTSNLKCTYDENYLLSCATVLANGTLFPITFAYQQYGSHYQWNAVSGPGILPTIDLYVEVVAPYPTTTTSSSSSIASSSSSSTSSYVTPTCTLTPRLPNSGFEDGTNQTAWIGTGDQYSSWAPSAINPYEGKLSGRITFRQLGPYQGSSSRLTLMNTAYNLCPGFNYSISYDSLCGAQESCTVFVLPVEDSDVRSYVRSTTNPSTTWVTNEDALEFTAASSTSILKVYVDTVADSSGAGYVYLDDFSIALLDN
ncbi:hypothetical protein E4T52_00235 [Aureobasidium sp. EXF-3400]|nr:hypothetical protein E4T51_03385 [Aureobasidium sp. EXF-12344]KAI4784893.1 hypothetical protein E4T52_00235 [Aureobasidium sp. EXF-3400]